MLKTTGLSGSIPSMLGAEDKIVGGGGSRADKTAKILSKSKTSKTISVKAQHVQTSEL